MELSQAASATPGWHGDTGRDCAVPSTLNCTPLFFPCTIPEEGTLSAILRTQGMFVTSQQNCDLPWYCLTTLESQPKAFPRSLRLQTKAQHPRRGLDEGKEKGTAQEL